jgi:hypothetical protein
MDAPFYFFMGQPDLMWLFATYLLAIPINYVLWRAVRLPFSEKTAKPNELFEFLWHQGGSFAFDLYAMKQQRDNLNTTK